MSNWEKNSSMPSEWVNLPNISEVVAALMQLHKTYSDGCTALELANFDQVSFSILNIFYFLKKHLENAFYKLCEGTIL